MKAFVALCAATLGAIVATERVAAQSGSRPPQVRVTPVRGVAYDSIRRQPLRDAFVSILGDHDVTRNTTTDSHGRFYFDSVPPGDYTFAVQHATLDSLGLSGVSRKATVADDGEEVRLGVPSFRTLWGMVCAGLKVPKDSGFLFGTIRDAVTGRPVAKALVEVSWIELMAKAGRLTGRRWRAESHADARGNYSICGIPIWEDLSVRASGEALQSGEIGLAGRSGRVERRDLLMGPADSSASHVGLVSGLVTDVNGEPFPEARVSIAGSHELRTDAQGRFLFRNVSLGSQQIQIQSVGVSPVTMIIDVLPHDTTKVNLQFGRPILLDGMHVTARPGVRVAAQEFDVRRHSGLGYVMDSLAIGRYPDFINVFNDVPGIRMTRQGGSVALIEKNDKGVACSPTILLDGIDATPNNLTDLQPHEVAAVEVYAHQLSVPTELLPPGRPNECGMVVVWTKYAFRSR